LGRGGIGRLRRIGSTFLHTYIPQSSWEWWLRALTCDLWAGRGQYSDAVLNELESQNDQQVDGILGKVRLLKDVSSAHIHTHTHRLPS
jgi:hypothetical protein